MSEMTLKLMPIINRAVLRVQEENRKAGVANVYVMDGRLIWQLPDGTVSNTPPSTTPKDQYCEPTTIVRPA